MRVQEAIAVFLVGDIASTMRWYAEQFAFQAHAVPSSPPHTFGILRKDDATIFLQQLDGYRKPDLHAQREGGVWSVYLQVDEIQPLFDRLSKLEGVTILEPLCHQPYGQTEFVLSDPNGYALVFAQSD
jgi:predicted enzyme related to lactoylglutathione lyase